MESLSDPAKVIPGISEVSVYEITNEKRNLPDFTESMKFWARPIFPYNSKSFNKSLTHHIKKLLLSSLLHYHIRHLFLSKCGNLFVTIIVPRI